MVRNKVDIQGYWQAVLKQNADEIRKYFHADAYINWHNTNEHFSVEEFIRANCEYPGSWSGRVERTEAIGDLLITATNVYTADKTLSFHVVSFLKLENNLIISVDEYWGDDGAAPQWRLDKKIGQAIQ